MTKIKKYLSKQLDIRLTAEVLDYINRLIIKVFSFKSAIDYLRNGVILLLVLHHQDYRRHKCNNWT